MRRGPYVLTHSGVRFYPFDPKPYEIRIEDIAFALSNICRYGGHVEFYSVAEHSVLVSEAVERAMTDHASAWTRSSVVRGALCGLLHDAAEAYPPGDILGPVKGTHVFAGVASLQREIESVVAEQLTPWATGKLEEIVLAADKWLLTVEAVALERPCSDDELDDLRHMSMRLQGVWKFPKCRVRRLDPVRARSAFLRRYAALTKELSR